MGSLHQIYCSLNEPANWHVKEGWYHRERVTLTEKNPLKSCAMLENAARWLSSCGRQQHSSRSLLSQTLMASERAVERNWFPPLLSRSRLPSGSMAANWGRGLPSGSKTNTTPKPVKSRMIQLLWWRMIDVWSKHNLNKFLKLRTATNESH